MGDTGGCGGRKDRQLVVLINKAHQRGAGSSASFSGSAKGRAPWQRFSEKQKRKIPMKQGNVSSVERKMCALVSFFHRVAMEPGHRTAVWFQPQERSLWMSCISSLLKVLTLIYGSQTAIWFRPFYLWDRLPASPLCPAMRGITCNAFFQIKCLGSQAGCYHRRTIYSGICLPPSLA